MTGHQSLDERPLSVSEVQQALRDLRARPVAGTVTAGGDNASGRRQTRGDTRREQPPRRGDVVPATARRIMVMAAHAGAGASTVSLALSDAAASTGRTVHLIDGADPGTSGLVAAATSELGLDATGAWRRGLRAAVTIDRRASAVPASNPPGQAAGPAALTVVDCGMQEDPDDAGEPSGVITVLVCRATVPAVRLTERRLELMGERLVLVAAVGHKRWPGEVTASIGPRLSAMRSAGQVLAVPIDNRLAICGLDDRPLPKTVYTAGLALLDLIEGLPRTGRPPRASPSPNAAVPKKASR